MPSPHTASNVYIVFGQDEFLVEEMLANLLAKLRADLGGGPVIDSVDCEEGQVDEVLAEIASPSLFAANRITVLRHLKFGKQRKLVAEIEKTISEGLVPGQVLILVAGEIDKRLKLIKTVRAMGGLMQVPGMDAEARERWVLRKFRELGKTADRDVARLLLDLKDDMRTIGSEIEKVATYVGDAGAVTVADIEAVVGRSRTEKVYELTRAVITRDAPAALGLLAELLDQPRESAIGLLYRISREIRCLIQVRMFLDGVRSGWSEDMRFGAFKSTVLPRFDAWLREAGISRRDSYMWMQPYAVHMRFKEGSGFEVEALVRFLEGLLAANVDIVSTSVHPRIILERLISTLGVEACMPAERR